MSELSRVVSEAEQAMSIKFNTMVYELERQGKKVTVLSLGEAFFDIPLLPMDDLPRPAIFHYSHSRGIPELRERLAEYFAEQYDVRFDPAKEILITVGSKAAIHMALMSVLDPGDEVLIPEPYWVSYPEQVKLCYGVPVSVPLGVGVRDWERWIGDKTKVLILNTPHNPRGYVYGEDELRWLLDLARERDLWLFSDEAYSDFLIDGSFVSLGRVDRDKEHAVVFNSISKNYGISGWRLGYVIANERLIDAVLKVQQHLITCPATILEHYVARWFREILDITLPQIREVVEKRERVARFMDEIGLEHLPGSATFYFFVSIAPSRLGSVEFCTRLLREKLICVVPGVGYGPSCEGWVRVSVGTAGLDEIRAALSELKRLIEATS
jgi:aspartate aminotransferase/aminotransferase